MPALLFVSYSGLLGGSERVLIDCSEAISGEHILACPEGPLARCARARGLRVQVLSQRPLNLRGRMRDRMLAPARLAGHALEVERLWRVLGPELMVAWGMRAGIACALVARGRRFVFSHHDFLPGPLIATAVRTAAAHAGAVLVPSYAVAEDLDPVGRLGTRLHVVHPGVEVERFDGDGPGGGRGGVRGGGPPGGPDDGRDGNTPGGPDDGRDGNPPGGQADPPEVLVLGALAEWKRPDLALEICALAASAGVDLRLRFVGAPVTADDPVSARLRARAARPDLAGRVELAGPHEDPRPDLQRATCLLHCAPREPFGIALIEALACGRPVIAPDSGGPREIVDSSCGVLYAPGNAVAGAAALGAILADPAGGQAMGRAGRARVQSHFTRSLTLAGFAEAVGPMLAAGSVPELAPDQLTLVTVTHNSAPELSALIASVERFLPGARLIVVDCASQDDSVAVARGWAGARTIELGANVGFGRGCNRGVGEVTTAVTALLNPDVELLDDSLLILASQVLRAKRPERLLAPLVLNADGTRQDTVHPVPASATDLITALVPPAVVPGRLGTALAPWRSRAPRPVGWAVGAALVARTETLRRLGPFDESIFMYGEDLELGLRAAQSGVETWFWPDARVRHHGGHTTRQVFAGEPFELLARARHDAVARRLGSRRAALDDRAQAVTFRSRVALKRVLGRPAARERRQLAALLSIRSSR